MNDKIKLARLRWACRRGMLELDLILLPFLDGPYSSLDQQNKARFDRLLSCTDPEIYSWLMGFQHPEDEDLKSIVTIIRKQITELA